MADLRFDPDFFDLLTGSFQRIVNRPLVAADMTPHALFYDAPFAVLAHDGGADPRFIYANKSALDCFGYRLNELIGLPSRLSAEAPERDERQRLLDAVTRDGFIPDYRGIRITKSGQRFWIENAVVWQLIAEDGKLHGTANCMDRLQHSRTGARCRPIRFSMPATETVIQARSAGNHLTGYSGSLSNCCIELPRKTTGGVAPFEAGRRTCDGNHPSHHDAFRLS